MHAHDGEPPSEIRLHHHAYAWELGRSSLAQDACRQLDKEMATTGYPGGRYFGLYMLAALLILFALWGTVIAGAGRT